MTAFERKVLERLDAIDERLRKLERAVSGIDGQASSAGTDIEVEMEMYFERIEILLHSLGARFDEPDEAEPDAE